VERDSSTRGQDRTEAIADDLQPALQQIIDDVEPTLRRIARDVAERAGGPPPRFSPHLPEKLDPGRRAELERQIAALGPWRQGPFVLADDLVIGGDNDSDRYWERLSDETEEIAGRSVLDVGSGAGFDSFMFRLRGAGRVLACEPSQAIEQARFLESIYHTGVEFSKLDWRDLDPAVQGRFDFVHCHRALEYEPDVMGLLSRLRAMVGDGGTLLFSALLHSSSERSEYLRFIPGSYGGDAGRWLVPGRLAMRWMLEVTGFEAEELALDEGPRAEFPTVVGYFRGTPADPAPELPERAGSEGPPTPRFPLGHYHSPVYDVRELEARRPQIWPAQPRPMPDVDWREESQTKLCEEVFAAQQPLAFRRQQSSDPSEFWADNDQYPALDAWVLAALIRHLRPARMIEVGSGFSTLISARVNREELGRSMRFTCVEPYPREFLTAGVDGITELRSELVQDTPLSLFEELAGNDVLFIDSSHVVKTGGDVTWIYHEVLPRLAPGVHLHVHDIFLPRDYPEQWVMEGWGWNEAYLVRSFLSYNRAFEIVWGAQFMLQRHRELVLRAFPGYAEYEARGGTALWLRRA
jgi:SAM-dependent methyltransferase/predicted O-methyltransferase YrrM